MCESFFKRLTAEITGAELEMPLKRFGVSGEPKTRTRRCFGGGAWARWSSATPRKAPHADRREGLEANRAARSDPAQHAWHVTAALPGSDATGIQITVQIIDAGEGEGEGEV